MGTVVAIHPVAGAAAIGVTALAASIAGREKTEEILSENNDFVDKIMSQL